MNHSAVLLCTRLLRLLLDVKNDGKTLSYCTVASTLTEPYKEKNIFIHFLHNNIEIFYYITYVTFNLLKAICISKLTYVT